jgi:hypothetical protein
VNGTVTLNGGDSGDFFEFQGLTGGESFNALGLAIQSISGDAVEFTLYSDLPGAETLLQGPTDVPSGTTVDPTGVVPVDGNLFVEIAPTNEAASAYSVSIATSSVPEPGTLVTLGIGLTAIGGIGLRRRKKG